MEKNIEFYNSIDIYVSTSLRDGLIASIMRQCHVKTIIVSK